MFDFNKFLTLLLIPERTGFLAILDAISLCIAFFAFFASSSTNCDPALIALLPNVVANLPANVLLSLGFKKPPLVNLEILDFNELFGTAIKLDNDARYPFLCKPVMISPLLRVDKFVVKS